MASPAGTSFTDLPQEALTKIASFLRPRDAAKFSLVNKAVFKSLTEDRQQQLDRQLELMQRACQARSPQVLMGVVQESLKLDPAWRDGPLEHAGHQLGLVAAAAPGEAAAAVFRAIWRATLELAPVPRRAPLLAIARHVATLPPQERRPALEAVLAQMWQVPAHAPAQQAARYRAIRDQAYLLLQLPPTDAAPALQRLVQEARRFVPDQRDEFIKLLRTLTAPSLGLHGELEWKVPLSERDRMNAYAAMDALLSQAAGPA